MKQKVFDYIEELEKKAKESEKYFKLWHEEKIKNNKAIEYIENCHGMYRNAIGDIQPMINIKPALDILKGVELTKNDKKQAKWLKEEFKVGVDKE